MAEDGAGLVYVECDGLVYLVDHEGHLSLPTRADLDFPVETIVDFNFTDVHVDFCTPVLDAFPAGWTHKDAIAGLRNVDPLVRRCVNATLIREVTGALIIRDGAGGAATPEVLMVKASRGFTKGSWNMPGGFIQYGETPEEGLTREVEEEVGLDVEVVQLLGVHTARFGSPYFMRAYVYECRAKAGDLVLDPSEIAEAEWMPLAAAYEVTLNPFTRAGLEKLGVRSHEQA